MRPWSDFAFGGLLIVTGIIAIFAHAASTGDLWKMAIGGLAALLGILWIDNALLRARVDLLTSSADERED